MNDQAQEVDPLLGQLVSDRYRILRKVGEGGMGTVYEALHVTIEKRIALKVLLEEYSSSATVVQRFRQEAISASRIKHPNVIDVSDFGQLESGACYIAMEYLEGQDLGDALGDGRPLAPERAVWVTLSVCRALQVAHSSGVVHRDLKPENIFLQRTSEGECVKIVDFGIAQLRNAEEQPSREKRRRRLTKTGMIFGTPEYMAPEQARGHNVDERSDIYAAGVILYEMLTGAVPFIGESFLEVLNAHNTLAVPPFHVVNPNVQVSDELWRVVSRTLEKEPDDRFASMADFSRALLACPEAGTLRPDGSLPEPPSDSPKDDPVRIENSSYPAPVQGQSTAMFGSPEALAGDGLGDSSPPNRNTWKWVLGGVVLVLVGGAALSFGLQKSRPSADRTQADELPASAAAEPPRAPVSAAGPDSGVPSEPVDAGPDREASVPEGPAPVVLHVVTEPSGALVLLNDFQVCDESPCEVTVEPGQPAVLTARKGRARAEAKVLAQSDQEVRMTLQAPRPPPRPQPQTSPKPADPEALCEVMVDGIKILRPCQ